MCLQADQAGLEEREGLRETVSPGHSCLASSSEHIPMSPDSAQPPETCRHGDACGSGVGNTAPPSLMSLLTASPDMAAPGEMLCHHPEDGAGDEVGSGSAGNGPLVVESYPFSP